MVFTSDSFVFLFLPIFLVCYALVPAGWRNTTILAFSWLFYAWSGPGFLLLLIGISIWSWGTGRWLQDIPQARRKLVLWLAIAGPLAALAWFKYANLLVASLIGIGWPIAGWQAVALPIGLSFFVFGAISYSVDVYRGTVRAEPSFINYATYQSMFGHLVAGPIVRYQWVAARLKSRAFAPAEFAEGTRRFMLGFAEKVLLADTLAPLVDAGYALDRPSLIDAVVAVVGFAMQLYFDFAAYSSMAIGLGLMVGLRFHENFETPYLSTSLPEFWRRWHISLSSWLRDYLYIPLGGSRCTIPRGCANLLVTMILGGLWHGANWTFAAWGLWHGAGLVIARLWREAGLPRLPMLLGHALTLVFVLLSLVLFRAPDWDTVERLTSALMGAADIPLSTAYAAAIRPVEAIMFAVGIAGVYAPLLRTRLVPRYRSAAAILAVLPLPLWLAALWVLQSRTVVPFLYFRF